ncbi:UDP-N-acetylmuramoyl-L-alanine--D-glutamate ligase [Rhodoferax sp. BAB1]|uniref:UDP-N-acetylmuramoyl-L-alanine--D-glutamate ligase n=1 Tax=Rhodoferax sp. BAB1 TaxID=2741720 RepID=UPI0015753F9E|nr:UDP-N-acetylmuramoyl-L-alanine--D-glutamate ligase [Rhodoferax sp. BAB1]QKO22917.1 UDP-N-acetylmuramoyl-L-alanine--D-glutamate ligase [Rhodoferax sp. BAB1]
MNENDLPDDQPRPLPPQDEAASAFLPADEPMQAPVELPAEVPGDLPVPPAGKPAKRALPETLTAAQDAKAFVAQLFADVAQAEPAAATETLPEANAEPTAVESPAEPEAVAAVPVSSLQGQHVLVLGLGASGLAMVCWCVRQGARVTVADTREAPPQLVTLQAELPQVSFRAGAFEASLVEGQDIRAVFKSPGLSPAAVAPVWLAAQAMGLWTGGELDLYAAALRELQAERGYAPKVLAVTGTNGKTTTTALTGQLIELAGKSVAVAGNIGPNLLDVLTQRLEAETLPEVWVLELSSFQLDGVSGFEPTASVVLNLTQDHLDWHGSMEAYGAAKARIFGSQGLIVLNRDDAAVMAMLPEPLRAKLQKPKYRVYTTFGADMPQRPGDYGIELVNGMAWLVRAQEADETQKRKKGEEEEIFIQRLMPADALRIRGRHNATNALAALALAQAAGCALGPMLYGLREYRGEPHRVEPVAIVNEVEYFDDSKGTNVGATVAALTGLGTERRIVVILGGDGKGQDFAPLFAPVQRYARAVVLIGRDAPAIRLAVQGTGVPLLDAGTLPEAVALARAQAQAGDAVLLSPACASFDMFKDYAHRASVFVEAVQALSNEGGLA